MALAQTHMPQTTPQPAAPTPPSDDVPLAVMAAKASSLLPATHLAVGRALSHIAGYLVEGEQAIALMTASNDPQDQHNARIHMAQHTQSVEMFKRLIPNPTEANLWWQLALHSFNQRRDHMSASVAFAVTASLSTAPMVLMSFYLLFHAWQHLCEWRDYEGRLKILSARIHASLGDTPYSESGPCQKSADNEPCKVARWVVNPRTAIGAGAEEDGAEDADEGSGWFGWAKASGSSKSKDAAIKDGAIDGATDGATGASADATSDSITGGTVDAIAVEGKEGAAAAGEMETLVMAMESPYIFLVTRLVDMDPILIRRLFARQAMLQQRSLDLSRPPPPPLPPLLPGAENAAASKFVAPRSPYIQNGQLSVAYLSGLPAGHVTYNLVGSMLRFHTDPNLKVYWCTAAQEPEPVKRAGLKQPWPHVIELNGLTPKVAAEKLREHRIGVLIDLDGWIGDEPPRQLMALHPAPIRGQWLGWAGTTGDPSMQFMVTDGITTPVDQYHLQYYAERFVVLPRAYQVNDHAQLYPRIVDPSLTPTSRHYSGEISRAAYVADGIGDDGGASGAVGHGVRWKRHFTFANFNQLMKVAPDLFSVWCGAMLRTPHTQLLLLTGVTNVHVKYPSAARNADREIATRGLRVDRLRKGPVREKEHHLGRASRCDLAVDTLSYNSHTTGTDSLWAGLPMLTQSGRYFASRVAGALVTSAGAPMMQVASLKAYEDQIHLLATQSEHYHARTRLVRHTTGEGQIPVSRYGASGTREQAVRPFGSPVLQWSAEKLVGPKTWGQYVRYESSGEKPGFTHTAAIVKGPAHPMYRPGRISSYP